jgi:hypothetical protein
MSAAHAGLTRSSAAIAIIDSDRTSHCGLMNFSAQTQRHRIGSKAQAKA